MYIVHDVPRYVRISGLTLHNQLVSEEPLGAELASVATRRYAQADAFASKEVPYLSWKHDLEADFAVSILLGQPDEHKLLDRAGIPVSAP
jgi:hypothetical protein